MVFLIIGMKAKAMLRSDDGNGSSEQLESGQVIVKRASDLDAVVESAPTSHKMVRKKRDKATTRTIRKDR